MLVQERVNAACVLKMARVQRWRLVAALTGLADWCLEMVRFDAVKVQYLDEC
jgi:hypothetical protein